jgi:hypothetical protein
MTASPNRPPCPPPWPREEGSMNKWMVLGFLGVISSSSIPLSVLAGAPGDHRVAARYGCYEVCATKCDQTWNRSVRASVEECYKSWGARNNASRAFYYDSMSGIRNLYPNPDRVPHNWFYGLVRLNRQNARNRRARPRFKRVPYPRPTLLYNSRRLAGLSKARA